MAISQDSHLRSFDINKNKLHPHLSHFRFLDLHYVHPPVLKTLKSFSHPKLFKIEYT